jgi:hypothetical protein
MSSVITVDYTGFETYPSSSPENWPILKNGINSTWRESLPQSLVNRIDSTILKCKIYTSKYPLLPFEKEPYERLWCEWNLEDMKDKYYESDYSKFDEAFCVWLIYDIPLDYCDNNIDTKIMDLLTKKSIQHEDYDANFGKIIESYWLPEAKNLMVQPNQTLYNVYNILWNHSDPKILQQFREDMWSGGW